MVNFEKIASAVAAATTREILKVAGTPGYGAAPAAPAGNPAQGAYQAGTPKDDPKTGADAEGYNMDLTVMGEWLKNNGAPNLSEVVNPPIGGNPIKDIATLQREWVAVKGKLGANNQKGVRSIVSTQTKTPGPQVNLARQRYESAIKVAKEAYESVMRSYGYDKAPAMRKTASTNTSSSVKSLLKGASNLIKRHKL